MLIKSSSSWDSLLTFQTCLMIAVTLRPVLASDGNTIRFPPLPEEKPYKLRSSAERPDSDGLVDISAGIANILRSEPPYDIINKMIFSKLGPVTTKQVLDYETPMIILASISLIFALVIPITGLIVCSCRITGKCGGSLDDNKHLDIRPTKKRKRFALAIVFCSVFLIVGAVIILVSSSKMSDALPTARATVDNVFDDLIIYKNNTFEQMNHIIGPEVLIVLSNVITEILGLGIDIVNPIIKQGGPLVINLVNSIINLENELQTSFNLLKDVQDTVSSLVSDGEQLNQALSESRRNISEARRVCFAPVCTSNSIPDEKLLTNDANFTQVPNITDTKDKVQDVIHTNLTQEADKGNKTFHDLPNTVQNKASNFTSDFKNYTNKVENIKTDFLRPLEDEVDKILKDSVLPYKDKINEYIMPDGVVTKYDKYRNIAYILIGSLVFVIVFLTLLGIILGMIGASTFDTPSTRGDISDLGGRILIAAAVFSVFCALFINILVAVVFLVGTNTSIVCRRVSDLELFKNTIDNPDVMDGFPLSKMFGNNNKSNVELTVTSILNDCGKNKAPWTVFKMDYMFNLTEKLNYRDKIPNLDEVFEDIDKTVSDTSVMTSKAKKSVNDSLTAGVQNINFTRYTQQTNKEIVQVSLTSYADNITKAANNITAPNVRSKLQATADALVIIHNNTVQPAKQKSERLKGTVNQLQIKANNIVKGVEETYSDLGKVETFLRTEAVNIAKKGVEKHVNIVFSDVDQLIDHVISQVRYDIAGCKPIHNMYHSLTSTVCYDYFGNLNASWIGFGLCAVFTLITIILAVRASKHFRRFHRSDHFRDSDKWDENIEMPWETGYEMNEPKNHLILP